MVRVGWDLRVCVSKKLSVTSALLTHGPDHCDKAKAQVQCHCCTVRCGFSPYLQPKPDGCCFLIPQFD